MSIRIRFDTELSSTGLLEVRAEAEELLMSLGNQIEDYERPYQIVYGEHGGEARIVSGADGALWPIWRARRMVVALLTTQIDKTEDEDEREALVHIRRTFQDASTGEVVWGMVKRWRNKKGKNRFIGMVQKGQSYLTAGEDPNPKTFVPSRHPTKTIDGNDHLRFGVRHDTATPIREPVMSEAERIADRMARASRKAVEGDGNTASKD